MTKKDPYPNGHTAKTKYGSGDLYGTGIRQKVGRMILSYDTPNSTAKSRAKKPPRSLA